PARIKQLAVVVIRAEQRRHRDQVSIAEPGNQFGRLAFVGGAVDSDPAVRPWLCGYPVDQFAVIGDLPLAEFAGARAERRPGAAGVHHDQRESRAIEQIPGRRVGVRLRPRLLRRLSTVIAGHPHDRADPASHGSALHRQPDIHGQPYAVTHWHVHRLETTRRVKDHATDPRTRLLESCAPWCGRSAATGLVFGAAAILMFGGEWLWAPHGSGGAHDPGWAPWAAGVVVGVFGAALIQHQFGSWSG